MIATKNTGTITVIAFAFWDVFPAPLIALPFLSFGKIPPKI